MSNSSKKIEIELELLSDGSLSIRRSSNQSENEAMLKLLEDADLDNSEISEFLKQSCLIKYLYGDTAWCG